MISTTTQAPVALSLFSGAGGMDIGIRKAGFSVLACVGRDLFCCETLRANVSRETLSTEVIEDDIRNIDTVLCCQIVPSRRLPAAQVAAVRSVAPHTTYLYGILRITILS